MELSFSLFFWFSCNIVGIADVYEQQLALPGKLDDTPERLGDVVNSRGHLAWWRNCQVGVRLGACSGVACCRILRSMRCTRRSLAAVVGHQEAS